MLHLPQSQERSYTKYIWYEEVKLLKESWREKFNCKITEEGLRKSTCSVELRQAQLDMYHLQKTGASPAMKGTEMMIALQQGNIYF